MGCHQDARRPSRSFAKVALATPLLYMVLVAQVDSGAPTLTRQHIC